MSIYGRFKFHFVCVFYFVCESGHDASRAAAEVFKGVCMCLHVSVSLI